MELRKLEEERAHFQKLASQRAVRLELDAFNKAKIRARQREVQQALELDMKIVNAFFRMDEQEKESKNRRKEELKKEMKLYMDHLREQQMIEKEREREIERLYAEEAERVGGMSDLLRRKAVKLLTFCLAMESKGGKMGKGTTCTRPSHARGIGGTTGTASAFLYVFGSPCPLLRHC